MQVSKKKIATVVATGAVGLAGAGVAFGYWTTSGTGSGAATTATGNGNALTVAGGVPNSVYPGDTAQTVTASVKNTGSEKYRVSSLTAYVTTDKVGCDGSNYLINGSAAPVDSDHAVSLGLTAVELGAKDSTSPSDTTTKTFSFGFNNLADTDQNACKSAAVTIHYAAS